MRTSNRRGTTMVELIAVMIAGSALMGITIAALVAVQRADRRYSSRDSERRAYSLLADQLRRDVHAAARVTWDADADQLTLTTSGGGRLSYVRQSGWWERRVSERPDQAPQLAGAFRAPPGAACSVSPAAADTGSLIRIAWISTAKGHDPWRTAPPEQEVVAVVGGDLALLHP